MKTTGITRRIDSLGRIVIPKEIRNNLRIKTGELLEIQLSDEIILLKKHSLVKKNIEFLKPYIDILSEKLKTDISITNLDEVIYSSNKSLIGKKIVKKENYIPLSPNGDTIGYLMIENIKNEDIIEFSTAFLERYFENM